MTASKARMEANEQGQNLFNSFHISCGLRMSHFGEKEEFSVHAQLHSTAARMNTG